MTDRFRECHYKPRLISQDCQKAAAQDRASILYGTKTPKGHTSHIFFTITYSTRAPHIKQIIRSNWSIITCDQTLRTFSRTPHFFLIGKNLPSKTNWYIVTYRLTKRNHGLRNLLVPINAVTAIIVTSYVLRHSLTLKLITPTRPKILSTVTLLMCCTVSPVPVDVFMLEAQNAN